MSGRRARISRAGRRRSTARGQRRRPARPVRKRAKVMTPMPRPKRRPMRRVGEAGGSESRRAPMAWAERKSAAARRVGMGALTRQSSVGRAINRMGSQRGRRRRWVSQAPRASRNGMAGRAAATGAGLWMRKTSARVRKGVNVTARAKRSQMIQRGFGFMAVAGGRFRRCWHFRTRRKRG